MEIHGRHTQRRVLTARVDSQPGGFPAGSARSLSLGPSTGNCKPPRRRAAPSKRTQLAARGVGWRRRRHCQRQQYGPMLPAPPGTAQGMRRPRSLPPPPRDARALPLPRTLAHAPHSTQQICRNYLVRSFRRARPPDLWRERFHDIALVYVLAKSWASVFTISHPSAVWICLTLPLAGWSEMLASIKQDTLCSCDGGTLASIVLSLATARRVDVCVGHSLWLLVSRTWEALQGDDLEATDARCLTNDALYVVAIVTAGPMPSPRPIALQPLPPL